MRAVIQNMQMPVEAVTRGYENGKGDPKRGLVLL
jgi:hypothetical protein